MCVTIYSAYIFPLHFLHLSFHKGCINEISIIADIVGFQVTSVFIPDLPAQAFDGQSFGNALYNIGRDRALNIWNKHKDYFNQFDGIITSDTAPLARIFLQNNYAKPVIIWICNRFDYVDNASLDCDFPDEEYYAMFRQATEQNNVYIIPYTPFESFYAQQKDVFLKHTVIKPSGIFHQLSFASAIPQDIDKSETFFIPSYLNDTVIPRSQLQVPTYKGRYNGPNDIKDFKGIIHIPYAWSNVAFFENMHNDMPYFIPSYTFMMEMLASGTIWWMNSNFFREHYTLSEWYNDENSSIITYFNSWDDLNYKLTTTDFDLLKQNIQSFAQTHVRNTLEQWETIINNIRNS
jgi:hypothetical protein